MPILRCKLRVLEVTQAMDSNGKVEQERVKLTAVYGAENSVNAQWSRWTPWAEFNIGISNPEAFNKLSKGHEFYVDFTPVEGE
jgi:hypothetical protein